MMRSWSSINVLCTEPGVATRTDPTTPPPSLSLNLKLSLGEGLPFTKGPLVFETTGAMGEETQKGWKSIVEMEADQRIPGAPQSRWEQGLEHTWSANSSHRTGYKLSQCHMP